MVGLGNERDDFAGVAVLRVLRPKCSAFAVFDHQAHEFHEVPDVEHAALVFDFREYRQFAGKLAEQRVIALAPLAEYHGRAEDYHLECVAVQRTDAVFGLNLAIAVAVCWVHGGITCDKFGLANGCAVAIHDGTAHENELLDAGVFCLLGAFYSQVGIYCVIEFCAFVAYLAVIAVGDSCHVINCIVLAKIKATPGIANHVECIDLILASEFRLRQIVGKGGADVAVRACD